ncbi:Ubiquitin carboxyl-terminal hydrolase 8 [Bienertia sinuspersici]
MRHCWWLRYTTTVLFVFLEELADSLSLIRDEDRLVAYRLPKATEKDAIVVFMHQEIEEHYVHGKLTSGWKAFGIPLVARVSNKINGSDICSLYMKLLNPFLMPNGDGLHDLDFSESSVVESMVESTTNLISRESNDDAAKVADAKVADGEGGNVATDDEFLFYLIDEKGNLSNSKIEMADPVVFEGLPKRLNVVVSWPEKKIDMYDTVRLSHLPEIFKSGFLSKRPQENVSLYRCLEAFLNEEPLGPEDMWYCPGCKQHRQASKKLDLWRLPEILVIHLKSYLACKNSQASCRYVLYAISNHYGSLGGGHYTAFIHHGGGRWYDFDDSNVSPINEDTIKTSAAYVLFYRRVAES